MTPGSALDVALHQVSVEWITGFHRKLQVDTLTDSPVARRRPRLGFGAKDRLEASIAHADDGQAHAGH